MFAIARVAVIICATVLSLLPLASPAQEPSGAIALQFRGEFEDTSGPAYPPPGVTAAGVQRDCLVYVFADLSDTQLANGTGIDDEPQLPAVAKARPDEDGNVLISVPPGRYSVHSRSCFATYYDGIAGTTLCCARVEADPEFEWVATESGDHILRVQTVDVRPGETTVLTVTGLPPAEISRTRLLLLVGVLTAFVLATIGIFSIYRLRPRYDPTSSEAEAKSLPLEEDPRKRATFDDIFRPPRDDH